MEQFKKKADERPPAIEAAIGLIQELRGRIECLAMQTGKILPALSERQARLIEKISMRSLQAMLATVVALGLNYARTEQTVTHTETAGVTHYQHEDQETTDILNYITGVGTLSPQERLPLIRFVVWDMYRRYHLAPPAEFASLDEAGLRALIVTFYSQPGHSWLNETFTPEMADEAHQLGTYTPTPAQIADEMIKHAVPHFERNQALYDQLWRLEIKVGRPKVRWDINEDGTPQDSALTPDKERANYDPINNVVHVNGLATLISEYAHADQYRNEPITSYASTVSSAWHISLYALTHINHMAIAYESEYHRQGSIEDEAHHKIEPKLQKEIPAGWERDEHQ
jgi:hypothetical protein